MSEIIAVVKTKEPHSYQDAIIEERNGNYVTQKEGYQKAKIRITKIQEYKIKDTIESGNQKYVFELNFICEVKEPKKFLENFKPSKNIEGLLFRSYIFKYEKEEIARQLKPYLKSIIREYLKQDGKDIDLSKEYIADVNLQKKLNTALNNFGLELKRVHEVRITFENLFEIKELEEEPNEREIDKLATYLALSSKKPFKQAYKEIHDQLEEKLEEILPEGR